MKREDEDLNSVPGASQDARTTLATAGAEGSGVWVPEQPTRQQFDKLARLWGYDDDETSSTLGAILDVFAPAQPLPVTPESVAAERVRDAGFTPGTWLVLPSGHRNTAVWGQKGDRQVCRMPQVYSHVARAERAANGRLIAAAPVLLEALQDIKDFCDDPTGSEHRESLALGLSRLLPPARAAISLALGPVREEGSSSCTDSGGTAQGPKSDSAEGH